MENKKGSGIFLGVIGVATLIVAIIGATFAFFSANAQSAENAVRAQGAALQLGYSDDSGSNLKYNLIPAEEEIALYAGTDEKWIVKGTSIEYKDEKGQTQTMVSKGECKDQNNNDICGTYTFNVGNPSFTTQQGLYGSIKIAENGFANLYFAIYDETGEQVVAPTAFTTAVDNIIPLEELNQDLLPSTLDDANGDGTADSGDFNALDPTTYTKICTYGTDYDDDNKPETPAVPCTVTNVRTYKMVIWIEEIGSNQTDVDSNMMFAAGINFTSANDTTGVTGVIAAAKKPTQAPTSSAPTTEAAG